MKKALTHHQLQANMTGPLRGVEEHSLDLSVPGIRSKGKKRIIKDLQSKEATNIRYSGNTKTLYYRMKTVLI